MWRLLCGFILFALFHGTYGQTKPKVDAATIDAIFNPPDNPNIETKNPEAPEAPKCECVEYYLCNNDSNINTNGMGIIDIRGDENECDSYLQFCCFPPQITKEPIRPPPVRREGCGTRHPDGVGFRIKGAQDSEAEFGELPWMTAILGEQNVEGTDNVLHVYKCGGALIHPQVVLTAAHCVSNTNETYKIRAGEWDTQTTRELLPFQDRAVKTVIIHPKFYAPAVRNDVALLILESPVDLAGNIDVVCLPPQDYVVPPGTRCLASGWGKDEFGKDGKYQVILKRIELPIVERDYCQERFRTTRLGKYFILDPSFVCAGGERGKDTCKGDGGSPLVCPIPDHPGQYQQFGMVAWGIGCGEDKIPGAYVNVPMFRDWIDDQLNLQKLDVTVYQY